MKRSSPPNQNTGQQPRFSRFNSNASNNMNSSSGEWTSRKRSAIDESDTNASYNHRTSRRSNTFSHVSNSNRSNNNADTNLSRVSQSMWDNFNSNVQSFECFSRKLQLKDAIHEMLKEIIPHIGVYIVGSSANGFGMNHSDVDICLMMTENEIDQKFEAIQILKIFSRALKRAAFIRRIEVIHAKVPIIKFQDCHNNLECDINLNNHIGIRNTHLLKSYSEQDWRVRPLVLQVKRWAKYHNINDASQSTVSSYSLALMTIFYLQTIVKPAVLPVLQDLYPDKFDKDIPVNELRLNEKLPSYTSENTMSLGELFLGFLDYYSKFNFQMNVISVRKGEIYPRSSLPREDFTARYSQWKFILIEEPFDLSNTARSVHDEYVFEKIRDVFIRSKRRLEETRNLHSLYKERFYDDEKFHDYDYDR